MFAPRERTDFSLEIVFPYQRVEFPLKSFCFGFLLVFRSDFAGVQHGLSPGLISRPRPWGSTAHRVAVPASTLGLWLRDASGSLYHLRPTGSCPSLLPTAYRSPPFGRSWRPGSSAPITERYLKLGLNCQGSGTMRLRCRTSKPLGIFP